MWEFFSKLLDTSAFPARWHCGEWSEGHGWLHVGSDIAIFLAYMAIPVVLGVLIVRRKDLPFPRILWLFVAFIALCGASHLIEAIIFWRPVYRLLGVTKLATAAVSWATVIALVPTAKRIMKLRSPEDLEMEVQERTRELAREKATLEAIVDSLDAGVVVANAQGQVTLQNRRAGQILGADIATQPLPAWPRLLNALYIAREPDFTPSNQNQRENAKTRTFGGDAENFPLLRTLQTGESILNREIQLQHSQSGAPTTLNFSASPVQHEGERSGAVACFSDITDRVTVERELARSNRDLEQFAYAASHDLSEPLRQIASYSQLLLHSYSDSLDDKAKRYLNYVSEGSERMQVLVSGLLDYSRVGTRSNTPEWCDTNQLVATLLQDYETLIANSEARVILKGTFSRVYVDPTQLRQVLQNLLANGLKFSRTTNPEVTLRGEDRGSHYLFSVKDNGIGIEPKHHERIFRVFQRLHTRNEFEGTGIGLALCQRIVTGWGGRIWLSSQKDAGSTFYFTLPKEEPNSTRAQG